MPKSKKFIVTIAFSLRLIIVPLAILRVTALYLQITHSTNWTFDAVDVIIFTQFEMHLSLISATLPCTRPFLRAANTGMWTADAVGMHRATRNGTPGSSYAMASNISKPSRRSLKKNSMIISSPRMSLTPLARTQGHEEASAPLPAHLEATEEHPVLDPFSQPTLTTVEHDAQETISQSTLGACQHQDDQSLNSYDSDRNFIKKTIEYDIQYTRSTRSGGTRRTT